MNLDFNLPDGGGLESIDDEYQDDIFTDNSSQSDQSQSFNPLRSYESPEDEDAFGSVLNTNEEYITLSKSQVENYLRSSGIKSLDAIKFEDEDGKIINKSFQDLTDEEKLNIIKGNDLEDELDDDEINLLNTLRSNNIKASQLEEYYAAKYQQTHQDNEPTYSYKVDDITDDELFLMDLKSRFPTATDEELLTMFEANRKEESLYNKAVEDLRNYYRNQEDKYLQAEKLERERQYQEEEYNFQTSVQNSLLNLNNISEIDLEDQDKQQIWDTLTQVDQDGERMITKLLKDPDNLVKAAWFILQGEQSMNAMADYYKQEITNSRKSRSQNNPQRNSQVTSISRKSVGGRTVKTLDDIDF